jgi:hypothetical protein
MCLCLKLVRRREWEVTIVLSVIRRTTSGQPLMTCPFRCSEMRIVLITTASPLDFDGVKRAWSATFRHLRRNCSQTTWPGTRNRHTKTTGPVFSRLKPLRSWHRKACFVAWRHVSTACLPDTASAKRLRKMRRKFSRAFAKIGRTPQSYILFVLPSAWWLVTSKTNGIPTVIVGSALDARQVRSRSTNSRGLHV